MSVLHDYNLMVLSNKNAQTYFVGYVKKNTLPTSLVLNKNNIPIIMKLVHKTYGCILQAL